MAEVMERDEKFAAVVRDFYGDYIGTYYSENEQVRADLFQRGEKIIGYVAFLISNPDDLTDDYLTAVRNRVAEIGCADCLELRYTE